MDNDYNNGYQPMPQGPQPGQGLASGSMVCGVISLVLAIVFGWTVFLALAGMILGIVGIVLAVNAKKQGNNSSTQTVGLVLGIIGTCLCAVVFVSCVACICVGNAIADFLGYAAYLEYSSGGVPA